MRTIIAFISVLAAASVLAQAYRWVDENGVVHYSDRPQAGAEQIVLPANNRTTRTTARPRTGQRAEEPAAEQAPPFKYESIEVVAPAPEETLWNIEGVLNVSLSVQPALREGHQVRVYFDGEASIVQGSSFQIQDVFRGVHNIQAEVIDETGQMMARSLPNRFYVQQNTIVGAN